MKVLLIGANGFIGSAIAARLVASGHSVTGFARDAERGRRHMPAMAWLSGDLRNMTSEGDWRDIVASVDVVINASGALQSGLRDEVDAVQNLAVCALVKAAVQAGVRQFIQISAVGAQADASNPFMASKALADAELAASGMAYTIIRPGLVIGRNAFGGTELLRVAAAMPLTGVEISGTGLVQCVAMSDLVDAVMGRLDAPASESGSFDLVEVERRSLGHVITLHRQWLGFEGARARIRIPVNALRPISSVADLLGWLGWRSPLRSNAIAALVAGVTGDSQQTVKLLGREGLNLESALAHIGPAGKADRWHSRLASVYPLALLTLAILWLGSGAIGLAQFEDARTLLVAGGMNPGLSGLAVAAGSIADLLIGAMLLFRPSMALALKAGLAVAAAYLGASLLVRPDLWLDPLAPMIKILPVLALTLACLAMSEER